VKDAITGPTSRGPVVVLVGNPGSGKTTVGKAVAKQLGVAFRDTDRDIEQVSGSSISDIFIEQGEEHFRELERAAVTRALHEHDGVLALGGGAILSSETRARLNHCTVGYLRVGLAAAMQRLHMNRSRPLLVGNVRGRWQQLAQERDPLYEEVATFSVSTDNRTPQEVAQDVADAINTRSARGHLPSPDRE
jgi:shikimate kinase